MTVQTIDPRHRVSAKSAALGLAGVGIAVGAALGVSAMVSNDGVPAAPTQDLPQVVNTDGARDSWEGRIGPNADRPQERSQYAADLMSEKLRQLR